MILCKHATQLKLWLKYIQILQEQTGYFNSSAELRDTLSSTISDWFDENSVDPSKYPNKYTKAIETQAAICWQHIFIYLFNQDLK